jgi:hypothetical protein
VLFATLKNHWLVAELMSSVVFGSLSSMRAMEMRPRVFVMPGSLRIEASWWAFWIMLFLSTMKPPPWITKLGTLRWKNVPSHAASLA